MYGLVPSEARAERGELRPAGPFISSERDARIE